MDVSRWARALVRTATRIGLVMSGDLLRVGRVLLLGLFFQPLLLALIFGAGDDLVVDAGNDFLDNRVSKDQRRAAKNKEEGKTGYEFQHIQLLRMQKFRVKNL